MKNNYQKINHTFPPFYDNDSRILILGSFPSVKSRENNFYYMHKQNRFYKVLSALYGENFYNCSIDEKKRLLSKHHIALYDVIEECEIVGSSDSSIKNVVAADIEKIMHETKITRIYLNGQKSYQLFLRYFPQFISISYKLPSTSPANAKDSIEKLIEEWKNLLNI